MYNEFSYEKRNIWSGSERRNSKMGRKMIIIIVGLLLLASFAMADVIVEDNMVSFYYDNSSAKSLYLAGTFND